MQQGRAETVVEPFFLPVSPGRRFCVYRGPAPGLHPKGAFVHVPAFGEEMNKSRRMVALQSRALARHGFASLQMDLHGTGDSDGDFADARWEHWLADVAAACEWLERRVQCAVGIWGLRLGALLGAQALHEGRVRARTFLMWQPVINGETFLTQFLRLRLASGLLAGERTSIDTRVLRESLREGKPLEIAGYELSPELAQALDGLRLADLYPSGTPCTWLEVVTDAAGEPTPASRKVISRWRDEGVAVTVRGVTGEPFWSTVEIAENAALIDATLTALPEAA
jgi:exosortase A-associated hydrolase 2